MRQGTVLWDTTPIVFHKPEVIPEVWPNPSPSRNDIQFMIDSALVRQEKSTDELLHRLIEERDKKKPDATKVNPSSSTCVVSLLKPIHTQVVHRRAALQYLTPLPSWWTTFTTEPPSRVRLLFLGCCSKVWPAYSGKGTRTSHLAFLCQTLVRPHILPGIMAGHALTLTATTKPCTPL
jgi:hypothetical protein